MRKRKSKEERNNIYWRLYSDRKSGKLDRLKYEEVASIFDISVAVCHDWLKKIDRDEDRYGNPILTSEDGYKFVPLGEGKKAARITIYAVPSDWQLIKLQVKKNILTGESIKDVYANCSPELRVILWKLLSFEIESIDPNKFFYPKHRQSNEITGDAIALKISPKAFDIWSKLGRSPTSSKSNWALESVIKPFFLHIGRL